MRELTTKELEEQLAEQLPERELMGSTGPMADSHLPIMMWHNPGGHHAWQDVGPQYYYRK